MTGINDQHGYSPRVGDFPAPTDFTGLRELFRDHGQPPLLLSAGRPITWNDIYNKAHVVVVTENFAREYWEEPSAALGKRVRVGRDAPWREIVGVVGNIHDDGAAAEARSTMFWPMMQRDFWGEDLLIRRTMGVAVRSSRAGTPGFLEEIRDTVWSVNGNLPIANVATLRELLDLTMALDGPDLLHTRDARYRLRGRASSRRHRYLWRDLVRRIATDT